GHDRDTTQPETLRLRSLAGSDRHCVADVSLERRGELLVEDDLVGLQGAVQQTERLDVTQVVAWHGEDRAGPGLDPPDRSLVLSGREGSGRGRRGLEDAGLLGYPVRHANRGSMRRDRA